MFTHLVKQRSEGSGSVDGHATPRIAKAHMNSWATFLPGIALDTLSSLAPLSGDGEVEVEAQNSDRHGIGSTLEAAALFADASGFTALTEKLSTLPDGAERMCTAMNGFLSAMIDTVHSHGGDVVKFAGDAVSVLFPLDGEDDSMPAAAARAVRCALALHERVHNYVAWVDPKDKVQYTLSLHIGVGVGTTTMLHLGGHNGRCELVFAGPPMTQSAAAEPLASSGETCLSPESWALVSDLVDASQPLGNEGFVLVSSLHPTKEAVAVSARVRRMPTLRAPMLPFMRQYVPLAAALKLSAISSEDGASGVELSEMRTVAGGGQTPKSPDGP